MANEPVLIRRTNTVEEADIIVAWLEERGVKAMVPDRDNPGVLAFGVTDVEGIEIFVADTETAERARTLLVQHDKERGAEGEPAGVAKQIEVTCEECGQANSFPSDTFASVQECSQCGAYLDMPGREMPGADIGESDVPETER